VEARSLSVFKTERENLLFESEGQKLREQSGRMELKNILAMVEWWSELNGPNGLISASTSYDLMISQGRLFNR